MLFFAVEVFCREDLQMAKTVIDGAFAQAPKHARKESAYEQQAGDSSANHDEGHDGAATVAKNVSKREQQEFAHGWLLQ
jgi:hypothetical protein